jgi:hypothetical protein
MKAKTDDEIVTLVDVEGDFNDHMIPGGTRGVVVECYETPTEGYAVDLAVPDESLVGGYSWENVILYPDQFEVVSEIPAKRDRIAG